MSRQNFHIQTSTDDARTTCVSMTKSLKQTLPQAPKLTKSKAKQEPRRTKAKMQKGLNSPRTTRPSLQTGLLTTTKSRRTRHLSMSNLCLAHNPLELDD